MIANPGSAATDTGAGPLERALADTEAERLLAFDSAVITDAQNPWKTAAKNLPFLAHALGVNLWEGDWTEEQKRSWLAQQFEFKAHRGTERAIEMALGVNGFDLVQVLAPPQGFYVGEDLTKEQNDLWLSRMPEIRIKLQSYRGVWNELDLFLDHCFLDDDSFLGIDDGPSLYGRKAVLRKGGVETPLRVVRIERTRQDRSAVDFESVSIPGKDADSAIVGDAFLDHCFIETAEVEPQLVSMRLDRTYIHEDSSLGVTAVRPGLEALDVRYERISDIRDGGLVALCDSSFLDDDSFLVPEDAADMLADRIRLFDPDIAAPMTEGMGFLDHDRLGATPYTAEVLVDLHLKETGPGSFIDETFLDVEFLVEEDPEPIEKAMRAIVASKALHDTVLASFAPLRPLQFRDRITSTTNAGDWVPDRL